MFCRNIYFHKAASLMGEAVTAVEFNHGVEVTELTVEIFGSKNRRKESIARVY